MIKEILLNALEKLNYSVFQQGTLAPDSEYPDSFITFEILDSEETENFDNTPVAIMWQISIIFYSTDPLLVQSEAMNIYKILKAAGFIPQGKGADILSDEPTHTGWINEYLFYEKEGFLNA